MSKTSKDGKAFDDKAIEGNDINAEKAALATTIRLKLTEYYDALGLSYGFRHFTYTDTAEYSLTINDNDFDIFVMGVATVEAFILLIETQIQTFIDTKEAEIQVLKDSLKD